MAQLRVNGQYSSNMYCFCSYFKSRYKKTRRPGGPGHGGSGTSALGRLVLGRTYDADGSLWTAYQAVTIAFWNFCSTKAFTSAD
jgi:hypothetical protein